MGFYDNYLTEERRMIRETAKRFAEDHIKPNAVEWEEAEEFPRELYQEAAKSGLLGVGFPEEVGGAGGSNFEQAMMIEGMMYGGSTGVTVGLGSLGIALPPLVFANDEDQIERFVRPVLNGEKIAALAVTEPGTGSDVAGVRTRAVRDGEDYVINGAKMFITSGVRADYLVTLCRTSEEPHAGLTFFVIESEREGVSVSRALKKTGWRASDTAELAFDNVRVPAENRVGSEGQGFFDVMRNFQGERLALAVYGYTTAEIALQESIKYAKERRAFGKSLTGFQTIRHKLADMESRVCAAKTLTYQVADRMSAGEFVVKEVSIAKNITADTAVDVTYDAVQIHGGMGYMRETLVERLSRDARLLPIGGGTTEIMKEIINKQMDL
jgi:acyl-CoA dehydrogenase